MLHSIHSRSARNTSLAVLFAALGAPALRAQSWDVRLAFDAAAQGVTIDPYVALNDHGVIGFAGSNAQGSVGFVLKGAQLIVAAPPIGGRQYLGAALDDAPVPHLITRDRDPGSPPIFRERLWDSDGSGNNTLLGNSSADFDSCSSWVDVNANGVATFTALINGSSSTALMAGTQKPPVTIAQYSGNQPIHPEIANDDEIVIKDNLGVVVWTYPGGSASFIAGFGDGFTNLGTYPGISSNGNAVAFYGNRGNGAGIFASTRGPSGRHLVPLAGDGAADGFTFFDGGQRIAVTSLGASSYQTVIAVFVGTQNGVSGVYSSSAIVADTSSGFSITPLGPKLVVAYGSAIGGKTVASANLYHPMNTYGQVAFAVAFSDGSQGILRADGDTDGDGLLDVWETSGIDADNDGVVDLDLHALGADPLHKDIFVEVDAMVGREPLPGVLNAVEGAFNLATVINPDGQLGVHLHAIPDELALPLSSWVGLSGGWPTDFDTTKAAHFGTPSERASAPAVLDAKRLAFHYCIFADQFDLAGHSGIAELPGNDFTVTLGNFASSGANEQAGTFMHELGHNLGLHHGGGDDLNYKPNYPSVMNYLWQLPNYNPAAWFLTYSPQAYSTLHESGLVESDGIGARIGIVTVIGPPNQIQAVPENGPVDFNGDGNPNSGGIVARDLNHLIASDPASPGETLTGYDDWSNLVYDFRAVPDFNDGVHPNSTTNSEIDPSIAAALSALRPGPSVYCTAKTNSLGCAPLIAFSGSPSLTGPDNFTLSLSNVRNQKFGLLVWSNSPSSQPFFGGTLCVEGPLLRKPILGSGGSSSGDDCSGSYSTLFDQAYMSQQGLVAGSTVCAQFWSRDASALDPTGIGLSAAIAFCIAP